MMISDWEAGRSDLLLNLIGRSNPHLHRDLNKEYFAGITTKKNIKMNKAFIIKHLPEFSLRVKLL